MRFSEGEIPKEIQTEVSKGQNQNFDAMIKELQEGSRYSRK